MIDVDELVPEDRVRLLNRHRLTEHLATKSDEFACEPFLDVHRIHVTPKRKPGRPKGTPRSGGRARGTPNKKNQVTREFIIREGAPVKFLCQVAKGTRILAAPEPEAKKRTWVVPTLEQRIHAATILARKIVPDLKAVEHAGEDGGNLVVRIVRFADG